MNGKRVLVIDDEPAMHKLLKVILEGEGFQIVKPEERQAARKLVKGKKPDVIILDIMMPEVDGFEILKRLKGDQETRQIPVMVLTVRNHREDIEKARFLGADLYMTKPFNPSDLLEAVNSLLSGSDSGQ